VLAAVLRIYDIESKNLWFDEIYSWKISNGSIIKIISETAGDIHPPFYYLVLKLWITAFSDSVFSMRMLSVVLALASMLTLYGISNYLLVDEKQRLAVLLLYAVSPLNIFYSQEVRMLNLNLFLTLCSVYYFVKYLGTPKGKFGVIYCIVTVLSLYTHYFALFILFSQIVYVATIFFAEREARTRLKPFFKYPAFAFAMFIPWLPIMLGQALKGQPWRQAQTFGQVAEELFVYFKDIFLSVYFTYESMLVMYISHIVALFIILFLLLSIVRSLNTGGMIRDPEFLAFILFFLPLAFAAMISFRQSIVLSRYLSILTPYLFILIVYFCFRFYNKSITVAVFLILTAVSLFGVAINYSNNFKNNDYRKIIAYIEANAQESDKLIVEPHFMGWAIDYHNKHSDKKIPGPSILGWNLQMQLDSLSKLDGISRLWMVIDYSSLDKKEYDNVESRVESFGYVSEQSKTFYLIPEKVRVVLLEKNTAGIRSN
jgi:uncharacterized membrane protein